MPPAYLSFMSLARPGLLGAEAYKCPGTDIPDMQRPKQAAHCAPCSNPGRCGAGGLHVTERELELLALAEEVDRLGRLLEAERAARAAQPHPSPADPARAACADAGPPKAAVPERAGVARGGLNGEPLGAAARQPAPPGQPASADGQVAARDAATSDPVAAGQPVHGGAAADAAPEAGAPAGAAAQAPAASAQAAGAARSAEPRGNGGVPAAAAARRPPPRPAKRGFSLWDYITGADRLPPPKAGLEAF